MHAMVMTKYFIYLTSLGCYNEAPRIAAYDEISSTKALQDDVDALDEARDIALARVTQYQQNL
jgi:hypothetical protein